MSNGFSVLWTGTAVEDLKSLCEYLAQDSMNVARKQYKKIRDRAKTLETFPFEGRVIPELQVHNIYTYRELVISPWRLFYRISKQEVYVLAIIDSRRDIHDLLLDRILR